MAARQRSSTNPWQVPQLQLPPQSATIPGTKFSTAACITERPTTASTTCSVPLCSINTIFGIDLFQVEAHLSSVPQSARVCKVHERSLAFRHLYACLFPVPGRRCAALRPKLIFEHSAERIAGQIRAEFEIARDREIGQPLDGPATQHFFCDGAGALQYHRRLDIVFARIGEHGMHGHVRNVRMSSKTRLHLKAGNILAAPAQVILFSIDEV